MTIQHRDNHYFAVKFFMYFTDHFMVKNLYMEPIYLTEKVPSIYRTQVDQNANLAHLQGAAGQEDDSEHRQQHQLPPPDGAVRLARLRQPPHAHLLPQPEARRDRIRPLRAPERRAGTILEIET